MLTITMTIMGEKQLARGFSRFGEGIKDLRPVFEEIHADFVRIEREQFASEGGRSGQRWQALSATYAEWKAKRFPGMPILQLTGGLLGDMTDGLKVSMDPMLLVMEPSLDRALWHQKSTARMPARKVVALTEADKRGWVKLIHSFIYRKAKEAGLA